MKTRIKRYIKQLREQLWFRPLVFCLLSIGIALLGHVADKLGLGEFLPDIEVESLDGLLKTLSSSMLVISTFALASMLSAYSSASNSATPRSFKIVVTDDVSQNALSVFIGSFIFSIVATVSLSNQYYDDGGHFVLFISTLVLFAIVVLTFIRWVDRISRLGRLEHTIKQVEAVANDSMSTYLKEPFMGGIPIGSNITMDTPVYGYKTGYLQYVDMAALQRLAEEHNQRIRVNTLPGTYVHPFEPLAFLNVDQEKAEPDFLSKIADAFVIGHNRTYENDPRYALIALSEIASRALSPAVNDPGTAIQIIGTQTRLFFLWNQPQLEQLESSVRYDLVEVPTLQVNDLFEDAFRPIARDGASNVEVMIRLQKAFLALSRINNDEVKEKSEQSAKEAYKRCELSMKLEADLNHVKQVWIAVMND